MVGNSVVNSVDLLGLENWVVISKKRVPMGPKFNFKDWKEFRTHYEDGECGGCWAQDQERVNKDYQ
jgi:hypothetical protein